ncbi:uncharacterized protein LOC116192957 isoform X1 [Punica granatum]|uniref:Uncharacterized protein LOC116192957 isoform X1 n=1 Tax=Punica granatum TaxID=22663 RepID=A0A6P8C734_PUNGR|nr:uncharacterized protein LOC116192957 isoform X1 [Punica granatum]
MLGGTWEHVIHNDGTSYRNCPRCFNGPLRPTKAHPAPGRVKTEKVETTRPYHGKCSDAKAARKELTAAQGRSHLLLVALPRLSSLQSVAVSDGRGDHGLRCIRDPPIGGLGTLHCPLQHPSPLRPPLPRSRSVPQTLHLLVCRYKDRRWDSRKMLGSGGMPSSHSATVMALAVSIGIQEGAGSSSFAIALVLACVVMYDATGVRLHAGRQAELLNQIVCELPPEHPVSSIKPLRDSLGHTPVQVVAGAVLGCVVAYLMTS